MQKIYFKQYGSYIWDGYNFRHVKIRGKANLTIFKNNYFGLNLRRDNVLLENDLETVFYVENCENIEFINKFLQTNNTYRNYLEIESMEQKKQKKIMRHISTNLY